MLERDKIDIRNAQIQQMSNAYKEFSLITCYNYKSKNYTALSLSVYKHIKTTHAMY